MSVQAFLQRLRETPEAIEFAETIAAIEAAYDYTPTAFRNGALDNAAAQNGGSCKIFAFAQLHGLSEAETLACFGRYYREDVLQHPDAADHQNIRNFIRSGWAGLRFDGAALRPRSCAAIRLPSAAARPIDIAGRLCRLRASRLESESPR